MKRTIPRDMKTFVQSCPGFGIGNKPPDHSVSYIFSHKFYLFTEVLAK
jgi:hypothetical protein